jgi:ribosomal protein S12 methylthiotransferase accessory factor
MPSVKKTVAVCGSGLIADAVATELQDFATIRRLEAESLSVPGAWDGLVVASDCWDLGPHSAAHKAGRVLGVPWMPIHTELNIAVIGPITRPDRPGCPVCLGLRREHNSDSAAARSKVRRVHAAALAASPPAGLDRLAASLIGTLAATEFAADDGDDGGGGPGRALLVRLSDLSIERHRFLPEPMCPACGGLPDDAPQRALITLSSRPKQTPSRYRLWSPAEHSEEIADTYVGAEAGLIHEVARSEECGLAVAQAEVTLRGPGVKVSGGGRTWDYRTSEAVAVLEALERYGGCYPAGTRTVVRAARADLDEPTLDPRRLGLHEDDLYEQLPHIYRPFTEESVCNWVWGYSLTAASPVLVPESCAYFWTHHRPDPVFFSDTTNGCALGSCLEEAILYGILEVAERDAFLLTWHCKIPASVIDLQAADDREPAITAAAITQATGYLVSLFDVTTEFGIPCVWAMATHPRLADGGLPPGTGELALFCAAGSHLTPERAALSALAELGPQLVDAIRRFPARSPDAAACLACPDQVRTIFDHAVTFGDPRAYERLGFLTELPARSRPLAEVGGDRKWPASTDLREDLLELVGRFRAENLEVIVVNQTAPEHQAIGLHCVRVLIPGTLPLTYGHWRRRLKNLPRLLTLPGRLGHADGDLSMADINQLPHPFAA